MYYHFDNLKDLGPGCVARKAGVPWNFVLPSFLHWYLPWPKNHHRKRLSPWNTQPIGNGIKTPAEASASCSNGAALLDGAGQYTVVLKGLWFEKKPPAKDKMKHGASNSKQFQVPVDFWGHVQTDEKFLTIWPTSCWLRCLSSMVHHPEKSFEYLGDPRGAGAYLDILSGQTMEKSF